MAVSNSILLTVVCKKNWSFPNSIFHSTHLYLVSCIGSISFFHIDLFPPRTLRSPNHNVGNLMYKPNDALTKHTFFFVYWIKNSMLMRGPKALNVLWQEWTHDIGLNKPASRFTATERGLLRNKSTYCFLKWTFGVSFKFSVGWNQCY